MVVTGKARAKIRSSMKEERRKKGELGKEALQTMAFEGTPYAHPTDGTVSGIAAIGIDDVKAFAARHYTRVGLTLGVSGAFPPQAMERLAEELSSLPPGESRTPTILTGTRPEGLQILIVEKETR